MEPTGTKRKLAAILMADVAGYSRLMGEDEAATVRTLKSYREVFSGQVSSHDGRVVNAPGDSILAEFGSVVDAVAAAVEIQRELAERNRELPSGRAMQFRIGINLGDVVVEEDALYGDGVNIAARLEALAEPGGICISRAAHDQVGNKLPLEYDYLGEHTVKNIEAPVRVYRVLSTPGAGAADRAALSKRATLRSWKVGLAAAAVALLAGGAAAGWWLASTPGTVSDVESGGVRLPTIAVLPFENLGGDPEQEYFADGITEDLITLLAQFQDLSVIARNSMFTYKGKAVDVRTVGEEMGADFVLEGSVRRSADRLRVTAQLLSASDGKHLWAETYDRNLTAGDVFALQDELAEEVATAVAGAYGVISLARFRDTARKPPDHLSSYECMLRSFAFDRLLTPESHFVARECMERVVTVDPEYAEAWAQLTWFYIEEYALGYNARQFPLKRAHEAIRNAIELDPSNPVVITQHAYYLYQMKDPQFFDRAREAVAANPRDGYILGQMGAFLAWAGEWEEGLAMVKRAIELNPIVPGWFYFPVSSRAYLDGDYRRGLDFAQKGNIPGFFWYHVQLAYNHAGLGELEEAREQAALVRETNPNFERNAYAEFRKYWWEEDAIEAHVEGLRKAGMDIPPDEPKGE